MKNITVYYPHNALMANRNVDFSVAPGEIHALVGENGAGKTTLMKVLYGLVHLREGAIRLRGREVQIRSPQQAAALGIGLVQQRFTLVPEFSVAQNVTLGREIRRLGIFNHREAAEARTAELIGEHHFSLEPGAPVSALSVGQRQQVEILKLLYRRADLLILDEPTAVLTDQETESLFKTLRELKARGKTVVLITHKLREVMEISDRVSVMRKGELTAVRNTGETSRQELAALMVGDAGGHASLFHIEKEAFSPGEEILAVEDLGLLRPGQARPLLDGVSFSVRAGEILGITAVAGNGLAELEDMVSGMESPSSGCVRLEGRKLTRTTPRPEWRDLVPYVPADRLARGSSLTSSLEENLMISRRDAFFGTGGLVRTAAAGNYARRLIREYGIHGGADGPVEMLSGGNIQKTVLAREISRAGRFILFAEPAWGLDVASSSFIYNRILELRRGGTAVLLLSSNLDEVLGLADTLMILYHGRVTGRFSNNPKIGKELAGEYMLGLRDDFSGTGGSGATGGAV